MNERLHRHPAYPQPGRGPLDNVSSQETLPARVQEPGEHPRLHGFDVWSDLAANFGFHELVLLALSGEEPTAEQARAFELCLFFLSPCTVNESPCHAARLAHTIAVEPRASLSVAAIGLVEEAHEWWRELSYFLKHLEQQEGELDQKWLSQDEANHEALETLRALLPSSFCPAWLAQPVALPWALGGLLARCGLRDPEHFLLARSLARWPGVLAEAIATKRGDFRQYPINVPEFEYLHDKEWSHE